MSEVNYETSKKLQELGFISERTEKVTSFDDAIKKLKIM